ncbi:hypothetical protein LCGC14_0702420 [marine sediment metagenome]|uniref:Uncharacterized protein n=1 Tax=marine sediment metagenome TaxID=412755 RepID=A0A0F9QM44_9ZZZZ
MGFVKETFLYCDICGNNYGADNRSEGLGVARLRSLPEWHYIKGKDICDECFQAGKHTWNGGRDDR